MNLLRAKKKDLKGIMDIIKDAQELLANQNIDQWQNGYPNESIIINDIDNNESYLLVKCILIVAKIGEKVFTKIG